MSKIYKLSRDITQEECSWLPRTLEKGEIVYLYTGPTYGAVDSGIPITEKPDELPFLEIPADALELVKPKGIKRYKPSLLTVHNSYGNPYTEPYMEDYPTGKFLKYDDVIDFLKTIDDIDWKAVLAEGEVGE